MRMDAQYKPCVFMALFSYAMCVRPKVVRVPRPIYNPLDVRFLYFYFSQNSHLISLSHTNLSFPLKNITQYPIKKLQNQTIFVFNFIEIFILLCHHGYSDNFIHIYNKNGVGQHRRYHVIMRKTLSGFKHRNTEKKIAKDRNTSIPSRKSMSYQNHYSVCYCLSFE